MMHLVSLSFFETVPYQNTLMIQGRKNAEQRAEAMRAKADLMEQGEVVMQQMRRKGEATSLFELEITGEVSLQSLLEANLKGQALVQQAWQLLGLTKKEGRWAQNHARKLWHADKLSQLHLDRLLDHTVQKAPVLTAETVQRFPQNCHKALGADGMARLLRKAPPQERAALIRAAQRLSQFVPEARMAQPR